MSSNLDHTHIDGVIAAEYYYHFPNTTVTVCALLLRNGAIIIGNSRPHPSGVYNEELSKELARVHARDQVWALEAYVQRSRRAEQQGLSPEASRDAAGFWL